MASASILVISRLTLIALPMAERRALIHTFWTGARFGLPLCIGIVRRHIIARTIAST